MRHKERLGGNNMGFTTRLKGRTPPAVVDYLLSAPYLKPHRHEFNFNLGLIGAKDPRSELSDPTAQVYECGSGEEWGGAYAPPPKEGVSSGRGAHPPAQAPSGEGGVMLPPLTFF